MLYPLMSGRAEVEESRDEREERKQQGRVSNARQQGKQRTRFEPTEAGDYYYVRACDVKEPLS